ncbi:MAG: cyclopropane-fatty-acyl-phospholipid synthase, partial [bacterium (Candidatus Stahlbacteria) CG23_combo_of_CG06-09_8_20_14_all_40_9]
MEWWKKFFDEPYGKAILESFEERASEEVNFIEDVLSLPKNAKILDLCCGLGRHSIELAKRGYKVTGVDVTSQYLKTARAKAKEKGVKIDFIEGEMRNISFYEEFDAAINMFTSF